MRRLLRVGLILAGLTVGLVLLGALLVDPRALLLPAWLASQPWKEACERDPVAAYAAGNYFPCQGSPLTPENSNRPLKSTSACPLEFAVLHGQVQVAEELLAKGADPRLCSGYPAHFFQNVLGSTCRSDPSLGRRFFELYARAGIRPADQQELLFLSARGQCAAGIELALSLGASVNREDSNGRTALHYVVGASEESLRLTAVMVANGANPDLPVSSGETARAMAKRLNGEGAWAKIDASLNGERAR